MKFIQIVSLALLVCAISAVSRQDVAAAAPSTVWNAKLTAAHQNLAAVNVTVTYVKGAAPAIVAEVAAAEVVAARLARRQDVVAEAEVPALEAVVPVVEAPVPDAFHLTIAAHVQPTDAAEVAALALFAVVDSSEAKFTVEAEVVAAAEVAVEAAGVSASVVAPVDAAAAPADSEAKAAEARFRRSHRHKRQAVEDVAVIPAEVEAEVVAEVAPVKLAVYFTHAGGQAELEFASEAEHTDFLSIILPSQANAAAEVAAVRLMRNKHRMNKSRRSTRAHARHAKKSRSTRSRHMLHRRQ